MDVDVLERRVGGIDRRRRPVPEDEIATLLDEIRHCNGFRHEERVAEDDPAQEVRGRGRGAGDGIGAFLAEERVGDIADASPAQRDVTAAGRRQSAKYVPEEDRVVDVRRTEDEIQTRRCFEPVRKVVGEGAPLHVNRARSAAKQDHQRTRGIVGSGEALPDNFVAVRHPCAVGERGPLGAGNEPHRSAIARRIAHGAEIRRKPAADGRDRGGGIDGAAGAVAG